MSDKSNSNWSRLKLIFFRFIFTYLVLYNFPAPVSLIRDLSGWLEKYYHSLWEVLCIWVGKVVFNQEVAYIFNGSGDKTYDYILILCFFCLSLIITVIWTLLDRKRLNYSRLFQYLYVYIQYVVCFTMIFYGTRKVVQSQFPAPWLERLLEPYGDSSPMGILWTFMGSSYAFNVFTGSGEIIGGLFLIFKRTRILGGLILVAILTNVVMLNFSYDVPVKLYSMHLLLMTFLLLSPDIERLLNFFFLNKSVEPEIYQPFFTRPKLNLWLSIIAKSLVTIFMIYSLYTTHKAEKVFTTKSEFYGIWNVEEIEMNGAKQEPLLTNSTRWRKVVLDFPWVFTVYQVDETRIHYILKQDKENKVFKIKNDIGNPEMKATLHYSQSNSEQIILEGTWGEQPFKAKLKKMEKKFLLQERGFHWINEVPYHR